MRLRNRSRLEHTWLLVVVLAGGVSVGLVGWTLLNQSDSVRRGYTRLVGPAKANALALATKYALEAADRAVAGATEVGKNREISAFTRFLDSGSKSSCLQRFWEKKKQNVL